jgi:hypothetical protein
VNRRDFLKVTSAAAASAALPAIPVAPSFPLLPRLVFAIDPAREKDISMIVGWKVVPGEAQVQYIYAEDFYAR